MNLSVVIFQCFISLNLDIEGKITKKSTWREVKITLSYRIFRCISRLFNTKNLFAKIVPDLYMDQKTKK